MRERERKGKGKGNKYNSKQEKENRAWNISFAIAAICSKDIKSDLLRFSKRKRGSWRKG